MYKITLQLQNNTYFEKKKSKVTFIIKEKKV